MSVESILIIVGALALGSFAKSVTGLGLPLVSVPVLAAFLGVERAIVIMVIPGIVSNVWMIWTYREFAPPREVWVKWIAFSVVGIVTGTWILASLDERALSAILAGWIWLYLLVRLTNPSFQVPVEMRRVTTPLATLIGGVSQGATGASGPVIATYFHALRLDPREYVFSVSSIFLIYSICQAGSYLSFGLFTWDRVFEGVLAVVPTMIVIPIGIRIARKISKSAFDKAMLVFLAAIGLRLAYKALYWG
jgi:uncharacterized membrane protein YfcA